MIEIHKELKINMDSGAQYIINVLNELWIEAFVVGGCVRDSLLNLDVSDWDICTDAKADKIISIFRDKLGLTVIDTAAKYGTVTVIVNSCEYEITTYRIDGEYSDNRHPSKVYFTDSLDEDLMRRDFTINAMAYNPRFGVITLPESLQDLNNRIIRSVGIPQQRFSEDSIRILRAIRFASKLGFSVESNTYLAALNMRELIHNTSCERQAKELVKLLKGKYRCQVLYDCRELLFEIIPELRGMDNYNQNNINHIYDLYTHTIQTIRSLSYSVCGCDVYDVVISLASLLHDVGKLATQSLDASGQSHYYNHANVGAEIAEKILMRLKFPSIIIKQVCELIKYHDTDIVNKTSVKRLVNKIGPEQINRLITLKYADAQAQSDYKKDIKMQKINMIIAWKSEIDSEGSAITLKKLAINGSDLINIGIKPGESMGDILNRLLELVLSEQLANSKECLLNYVINTYNLPGSRLRG